MERYNEIDIDTSLADRLIFKYTSSNYFVFPNGHVERVTEIVHVEPVTSDTYRPPDSRLVFGTILNKVETQFADTPPSDASATPPSNGLVPGPTSSAKSEVHAVIISGNTRAENVIVGQTLISLTGGIVALGNSSPIQQSTVLTGAVTTNFDKGVILKAWGRNQPQQLSLIKK